ncbi:EF-hand domain-containing protein [Microcoleus sp. A003_D6]|uniref:EF-hand domain-containing protein n=1 Tax=Microcoleus sp. A003_D6 TaxID=3055266 RepID=UPI002FD3C68A
MSRTLSIVAPLALLGTFAIAGSQLPINASRAQDAYILLVNPNFFLWAALFAGVSTGVNQESLNYAIFWAALGFFCIPFIEQTFFMNAFSRDLLRETLRSSKVATEDVKKLFHQLDTDGSKSLDKQEIMELLGMVEDLTTGERSSEEMRSYITDYLFTILDSDKNGSVDLAE